MRIALLPALFLVSVSCMAGPISSDHQTLFSLLSPHSDLPLEWSNFVSIQDPLIQPAMGVEQADGAANSVISLPVFFAVLFSLGTAFKLIYEFQPVHRAQDYLQRYFFEPREY